MGGGIRPPSYSLAPKERYPQNYCIGRSHDVAGGALTPGIDQIPLAPLPDPQFKTRYDGLTGDATPSSRFIASTTFIRDEGVAAPVQNHSL